MPAYRDNRDGTWRYRKWISTPQGKRIRVTGTPPVDTKVAAEAAERAHIDRVLYPERHATLAAEARRKEEQDINHHAKIFLETYKPEQKPSAKREKESALNVLLPVFGELAPSQLTQQKIDAFTTSELERGMSRKTVNNRLTVLSSLIKYATGEPKLKQRFKLKGKAGEIKAVETADVEKLLAACKDLRYRAVILLATEAGLRAGEIRGLQWTDIKNGILKVRRALDAVTNEALLPKHDTIRTVPLSPRIGAVLEALPKLGLWVVSRLDGGALGYWAMNEAIAAIYDRAEVARPAMLIHCMRHTFGTVMARKVPLPVLQKLMGHEDIDTTVRYIDTNEDDKVDAIAAVFGRSEPLGNGRATESIVERN